MVKAPKHFILELAVFVCGALLMIFEIIGSRILSPFIGTSTYIWTSLIGVILASLSLGYWLGGKWADRKPDIRILAAVIFLAGGCVSATILAKEIVLSFIAASGMILEIKSLLAALMLFAPASVALGFVTPYAVRLRMLSVEDSGKTVGRLFAFSTVGSIVGTFAAGFFLIPFVGSVRTLYMIAGGLILLSILIVPFTLTRFNLMILLVFLLGVAASEFNIYYLREANGLHDVDTEYSRIQVFQTTDKTGKPIEALATDPYFVQSAIYLDGDDRVLEYSRFYHLLRHFKPGFQRTLMIGGAGFTFPREYLRTYHDATIDVVEIDPKMVQIARKFFRLKDDPRMKIVNEDGRVFLNRAPSGSYDAVLMDAFGSLFSVPPQLTTIEAVQNINRVLDDDGVLIANLGSAIKGPGSLFLQAEVATYKQVFPNVYLFKVNTDYADERLQNVILVASKSQQPVRMSSGDGEISYLLSHRHTAELPLTREALTDDLAPVEYYNSVAQDIHLANRR